MAENFPNDINNIPVPPTEGGTGQSSYVLGDTLYSGSNNNLNRLNGNTSVTKKFLSQTGNGILSAAPTWTQPAFSDITGVAASGQIPDLSFTYVPVVRMVSAGTGLSGGGALSANITLNNTGLLSLTGGASATNQFLTSLTNSSGALTATLAQPDFSNLTGTASASQGGTGQNSYTIGDLLYASGSNALSKLPAVATGQVLGSAGTGTAPAYTNSPSLTSLTLSTLFTHNGSSNHAIDMPTAGGGIRFKSGANCRIGTGTLSGGTVTISHTSVTANSMIFLTPTSKSVNSGILSVGTVTASTSFVVNSTNSSDANTFNYIIFEKS